ncbi:exported hypothetical protein [Candidatus Contendobacter odensis Run_B_J11]|uniref:Uncharacterized protein n=1 Tax=Candidatus Contendobacter odensis Run_B_J11 TaxID=1400861 RepID=A0A7U7GBQ7_9GAMM|nr:exported hypothetical protein [Candidatus Contendobacter odensis Run_B_J11]
MAIESLIGLSLFTLVMVFVAVYADKHRTHKESRK